jgi:hypothetical protein
MVGVVDESSRRAACDGLAALRTVLLNEGWESYCREGRLMRLAA